MQAMKSELKKKDAEVEELVRKNQKLERDLTLLEGAKRGKRTALERISYCLRPIHYQFPPFFCLLGSSQSCFLSTLAALYPFSVFCLHSFGVSYSN